LRCAARIFEGTATIRTWLKTQAEARGKRVKLPPEIKISQEKLRRFGVSQDFTAEIATAQDLYHKLRGMRDAVAHFLIEREGVDIHVYLAEGAQHSFLDAFANVVRGVLDVLPAIRKFRESQIATLLVRLPVTAPVPAVLAGSHEGTPC
jgi:hypothetical protein